MMPREAMILLQSNPFSRVSRQNSCTSSRNIFQLQLYIIPKMQLLIPSLLKKFSTKMCQPLSRNIQTILKVYSQELAESRVMQSMIPREFEQGKLLKMSRNQRFSQGINHISSLNKTFSQPIWDLLDRGGKRWRPVLCMLIAELLGHKRSQIFDIAALCEIIHNGTLLVDDIEDSSTFRRNKPCIHLLYGTDIAINAGNLMYYAPMLHLQKSGKYSPEILLKLNQIYLQEMVQLHIGQGWDILWHNIDRLGEFPTEDQYLQMTAHKTGVLARLSSRMVCACLQASEEQTEVLVKFVENMGVAFQIQDDLLNLQGQQFKKTKGYNGQDIHQGKITLMVIHYLQNSKNPNELLEILKKKTQDKAEILRAILLLKETGSMDYARRKMHTLIDDSYSYLNSQFKSGQNQPESLNLLKKLAEYGIKRQN